MDSDAHCDIETDKRADGQMNSDNYVGHVTYRDHIGKLRWACTVPQRTGNHVAHCTVPRHIDNHIKHAP